MQTSKPKVYVIVPLTIPGMNKAVFYETFQRIIEDKGFGYSLISLKRIKKEFAEKLVNNNSHRRHQRFSPEETSEFIKRKAKQLFRERFEKLIREAGRTHLKAHFICVEKNHPPNALKPVFRLVQESSRGIDVTVIALVPTQHDLGIAYEVNGLKCYHPISANLFFTCFDRIQKRQDHETLNGDGSKSAETAAHFLCLFKDFCLDKEALIKEGFNKVLYVPFAEEKNPPEIPKKFLDTLIAAVKSYNPANESFKKSDLENLNAVYEELQLPFKAPEIGEVEAAITRFLDANIYPEVFSDQVSFPEPVNVSSKETKVPATEQKTSTVALVEEKKEEEKPAEASIKPTEIKYEYRRQKVPMYLGIFPGKSSEGALKEFTCSGLKVLTEQFKSDESLKNIAQDIEKGNSKLKFIEEPHVMAYLIGEDKARAKSDYFKSFSNDKKVDLELAALIVIPGKIVIALCNPDYTPVKVYEGYSHMTLMKSDSNINASATILDKIFAKGQPMNALYQSKELFTKLKFVDKVSIKFPEGSETVYVVKLDNHLIVSAETGSKNRMPN